MWIGLGGRCSGLRGGRRGGLLSGIRSHSWLRPHPRILCQRARQSPAVHQPTITDTPDVLLPLVTSDTPISLALRNQVPRRRTRDSDIGGADLIAFLNNNDIWVMGVDGSNLTQVTTDEGEKNDLQWSPDGDSLFYISGKCIQSVPLRGELPR